jgi:hypothetical protein
LRSRTLLIGNRSKEPSSLIANQPSAPAVVTTTSGLLNTTSTAEHMNTVPQAVFVITEDQRKRTPSKPPHLASPGGRNFQQMQLKTLPRIGAFKHEKDNIIKQIYEMGKVIIADPNYTTPHSGLVSPRRKRRGGKRRSPSKEGPSQQFNSSLPRGLPSLVGDSTNDFITDRYQSKKNKTIAGPTLRSIKNASVTERRGGAMRLAS